MPSLDKIRILPLCIGICAILLIEIFTGYGAFISPQINALHETKRQKITLKETFKKNITKLNILQQSNHNIAIIAQKHYDTLLRFMHTANDTKILKLLTDFTNAHQVELIAMTPKPKKTQTQNTMIFQILPIQVSIQGGWQALLNWLSDLHSLPWSISIEHFTLQFSKSTTTLNALIEVYHA